MKHISRKLSVFSESPAASSKFVLQRSSHTKKQQKDKNSLFSSFFSPIFWQTSSDKKNSLMRMQGWNVMKSSGCKAVQRANCTNCFVAQEVKKTLSSGTVMSAPQLSDASCPASSGRQLHPQNTGPSWGARFVSHSPAKRRHKSSSSEAKNNETNTNHKKESRTTRTTRNKMK